VVGPAGRDDATVRRAGALLSGEALERGAVMQLPALDATETTRKV
jgi:hypothetical protein